MEGGDPDTLRAESHDFIHTLAHLTCRLIGKCDSHDIPRIHTLFLDQIGDPVGQHSGLS